MKKFIYIVLVFVLALSAQKTFAQNIGDLNGIYYQAVAIDEDGKEIVGADIEGKPLYEKAIGVRFTITAGLDGDIQWQETHSTTTDKYGLFTLIIGQGTQTGAALYDTLLNIPWIDANQFLKVEIAVKNDDNYRLVSNQQFMSVPYAFYADDIADNAITSDKIQDSTINSWDMAPMSVTTVQILNETILAEDIAIGAVTTEEILDSTILNIDISTNAIDSRTILDSTILNIDIATGAVDSRAILDSTILNIDIATGAVDSRAILDSTILNIDIATGAIDTRTILDSTILNIDIATGAIDTRTILNGTILGEDIATGAVGSEQIADGSIQTEDLGIGVVTTIEILDSTILNIDISTGAIDSRTILNETILAEDIASGAVTSDEIRDTTIRNLDISTGAINSRTILDETIAAEDIGTGAVTSDEILNETILAGDIATGAVTTSEILNETILAEDIAPSAVTSSEILNLTILNEDIANATIDLTTKVTGVLPVANGGTGAATYTDGGMLVGNGSGQFTALPQATNGQIPVGVTGSDPVLKTIAGVNGVNVTITADSVKISSPIIGVSNNSAGLLSPGIINPATTWISADIPVAGVDFGDIVTGTLATNLQGCMFTIYISSAGNIKVAIFNGTAAPIDLGVNVDLRVMVVQ